MFLGGGGGGVDYNYMTLQNRVGGGILFYFISEKTQIAPKGLFKDKYTRTNKLWSEVLIKHSGSIRSVG